MIEGCNNSFAKCKFDKNSEWCKSCQFRIVFNESKNSSSKEWVLNDLKSLYTYAMNLDYENYYDINQEQQKVEKLYQTIRKFIEEK